jgi:hypothetical protein
MAKTSIILDYNDKITFREIDLILEELKDNSEFKNIKKSIQKRAYSILVECAENICKYSNKRPSNSNHKKELPYISLKKQGKDYFIKAGNLILNRNIDSLKNRLNEVNHLGKPGLKELYEKVINKEQVIGKNGAGLGLITIALRANSKINYKFTPIDSAYSYIELQMIIY